MLKDHSKIIVIIILLTIIPLVKASNLTSSEQIAFGVCYQRNGTPTNISGEIYCRTGEVYTPIEEMSLNALDTCAARNGTSVNMKGTIYCQEGEYYIPMDQLVVSAQNTPDSYQVALSLCSQKNGTPVNVKSIIYCKLGEDYVPLMDLLSNTDTINFMGINLPNLGGMINPKNPSTGWLVIIIIAIVAFAYIRDQRELRIERQIHRIPKNERDRERVKERSNDRRRRRSDGGYY